MINRIDLLSGYGGISLALAPWVQPILYCEIEPYAQAILLSRMASGDLPNAPIFTDITKLSRGAMEAALSFHTEETSMSGRLKKLSEEDVREAVRGYDEGESLANLAHISGVTRQSMWDLLKRRTVMRPQQRYGAESHFYRGGKRSDDRAHKIVEAALRSGRLVNPGVCETCGESRIFENGRTGIQAHHDDYNKSLTVRWLCQACHHRWHRDNEPVALWGFGWDGRPTVDINSGNYQGSP